MPRSLRWIASATTALVVQFAFFVISGAIAVGTGNKELSGASGALITLGATILPVVTALAVNDWLAKRYPLESGDGASGAPAQRETSEV